MFLAIAVVLFMNSEGFPTPSVFCGTKAYFYNRVSIYKKNNKKKSKITQNCLAPLLLPLSSLPIPRRNPSLFYNNFLDKFCLEFILNKYNDEIR